MTKDDLKILKSKLPKGYRSALAEKFGYRVTTIDRFIRGDSPNSELIEFAVKMAEDYQEEQKVLSSKINKL